jgi:hypothetical protein
MELEARMIFTRKDFLAQYVRLGFLVAKAKKKKKKKCISNGILKMIAVDFYSIFYLKIY